MILLTDPFFNCNLPTTGMFLSSFVISFPSVVLSFENGTNREAFGLLDIEGDGILVTF